MEPLEDSDAATWRARIRSNLGGIRARQARWSEAISACRQAIGEAEPVGELRALAHACYILDWALVESGRSAEATNSWRALEIYRQLGDPEHEHIVLNNLGGLAYWDGRWDEAIDLYRQAGEASERAGRPADTAYTDCNVGEIRSDQGQLDEAEEHLLRARRIWSATGDQYLAYADLLLARIAVRRGRSDQAMPMLEAAMAELRRMRVDLYANLGQALIAEAEAFGGDPMRALEIASRELEANDEQRPLLTRAAGIALARLGEKRGATRELTHSLQTARDRGSEYDVAATIDVLHALDDADDQLVRERDEIVARLRIERLPAPVLT